MTRLLPFSIVAGLGFVVQLGAATALTIYGWSEGVSTAFAVECAVLHNFAWHQRWTWRDRRGEGSWIARLVAFHAANGVTSIAANVALVGLLARWTTLGLTVRTGMAVCLTGLLNYAAADRLVFGAPFLARRMRAHSQRFAPGAAVVMMAACIASRASAEPSRRNDRGMESHRRGRGRQDRGIAGAHASVRSRPGDARRHRSRPPGRCVGG